MIVRHMSLKGKVKKRVEDMQVRRCEHKIKTKYNVKSLYFVRFHTKFQDL